MRALRRMLWLALAIAAVVAGACSDDEDGSAPAVPTVTTAAPQIAPSTAGPGQPTTADGPEAAPGTTSAPRGTAGSSTTPDAAPTCGSGEAAPGVSVVDIESGGLDRRYRLYVPPAHDGTTRLPVVLGFHGLGSSAEQQAALSNLEGLAGVEGFIAVHPQGSTDPATGLPFFEFGLGDSGVDDVGFVADVLDHLDATLCVDTARVYSTGFSNGGYMSSRLACELSDRIAAVAPVAATFHPDDCSPNRPVPVLAFHGIADVVVPYAGGASVLRGASTPESIVALLSQHIADEVAEWATANGCAEVTETDVSDEVSLTSHSGCDATVALYTVDGGGHTWPGSIVGRAITALGHTTTDIDATALAWEFFEQHPL